MGRAVELRPYQQDAVNAVREQWADGNMRTLLVMATGCHEPTQGILMADGSIKQAQDVGIGDLLMGPDGAPRTVIALHAGSDEMFRVAPIKGDSFVVNSQHLLQLVHTNRGGMSNKHDGEISAIKACEWNNQNKSFRHVHKLYRATAINKFFGNDGSNTTIDPYFIGVLLGDGQTSWGVINITTPDEEIIKEVYYQANKYNMTISTKPAGKAKVYYLHSWHVGCKGGRLHNELKALGMIDKTAGNKAVPFYYKTLPLEKRLDVLAGLLDTDGSLTTGGYDFISKSRQLSEDVAFIARSSGLAAYVKESQKSCGDFTGTYWRVSISGDCSIIPCRISRKKAPSRKQKKNVLRTGFSVESVGVGKYYGFTVDGDNLYLLDDFTVTHNCGKTTVFGEVARRTMEKCNKILVLAHRAELIDQAARRLSDMCGVPASIEKADSHYDGTSPICVASVQTLQGERLERFPIHDFAAMIIDEAHHSVADTYRRIIDAHGGYLLGVTATADRADKRGLAEVYDSIAYEYPIARAVAEGYLCRIKAKCLPLQIDISKVKVSHGDYQAGELGHALEVYLPEIAKTMAVECEGRKTVCFLPLVSTAEKMAEELNRAGMRAIAVSGYDSTEERNAKTAAFERGDYDVLCNAMLLCLDEQTEVLTTRGFVGPDDIREDDLVANWNFDGSVFFEKPHEIVKRPLGFDEHMTSIESRTINLRVTNTHRMIVSCGAGRSKWKKVAAEELRNGHLLPACGIADPLEVKMPTPPYERLTYKRIESGELSYTHPSDLTLDECRFIGFFLAEGSKTNLRSGGVEYKVCQVRDKNPAIVEWFDNVVKSTGFNATVKEKIRQYRSAGEEPVISEVVKYWSFCRGTGHGKQARNGLFRIEPYLDHDGSALFWGLDEQQFDALIEGFWYGDGFHGIAENGMPRSIQIRGCYQKLFDLWCAIGSVRGWRCAMYERPQKNPKHNTQYEMRLIKNKPLNISYKTTINQEAYRPEQVWCVRTSSRNIITRRNGRVVVMGNTEGWDCPSVDCVVVLRPTKSRSLFTQMIGRGTRPSPATGKEHLLVLDFLWMTDKHDLCRPASLLGKEPEVAKKMEDVLEEKGADPDAVDLFDLAEQCDKDVAAEREAALAAELEKMRRRKKKLVDPLQFAMSIQDLDLIDFRPTFSWEMLPPTDAQKKALDALQMDSAEVKTRGQATKLLEALHRRIDNGLATPKQVRCLERFGFQHVGTWSFDAANEIIKQLAGYGWKPWMLKRAGIDPATYDPRSVA